MEQMEPNFELMDDFLEIHSKIGKCKLLGKDVSEEVKLLRQKATELEKEGFVTKKDFAFEGDDNEFLQSVETFVNMLISSHK